MRFKWHIAWKARSLIHSKRAVNVNITDGAECMKESQVVETKIYGKKQMIEYRCFRI